MAGSNPDFDKAAFETGIRFSMRMGLPPAEEKQVEFHFPQTYVHAGSGDDIGVPFDFDEVTNRDGPVPIKVDCAVEFFYDQGQAASGFGIVQATRIRITLLSDEYTLIEDCSHVSIDGDIYEYRFTEPPLGLFDSGIFLMHFTARAES